MLIYTRYNISQLHTRYTQWQTQIIVLFVFWRVQILLLITKNPLMSRCKLINLQHIQQMYMHVEFFSFRYRVLVRRLRIFQ